jgi:hypothetical protein
VKKLLLALAYGQQRQARGAAPDPIIQRSDRSRAARERRFSRWR